MVTLEHDDFLRRLHEQLHFLRASAVLFDLGYTIEARRLATVVYTLLIDRGRATSLATHLGWADLKMIDSGSMQRRFEAFVRADILKNGGTPNRLVQMGSPLTYYTNSPPSQQPHLAEGLANADRVSLKEWKGQTALHNNGAVITRKDLLDFLRDKDGGAHIDATVGDDMHSIVREGASDFRALESDLPVEITNTAEVAMRQIAFEVGASIQEHLRSHYSSVDEAASKRLSESSRLF